MKKLIIISLLILTSVFAYSFIQSNQIFDLAKTQVSKYNPPRKDYVIVIDYTKPIFIDRLFVLDMKNNKVVLSCKVSHSFYSGILWPSNFSNVNESQKSCNGNFITGNIYYGKFGKSMNVFGMDKGINDNASQRRIVFHSNKDMMTPWSSGCFATSEINNNLILNTCGNGCLVVVKN